MIIRLLPSTPEAFVRKCFFRLSSVHAAKLEPIAAGVVRSRMPGTEA
jgi:hypothetical protein